MEPALTAAVEPVRRVRGIKNKDINPVCSLSLSPGRSSSDLPGCLRGTSVSPETRSVCLLSRAQKGPSLRRSRACVQLCWRYPPSSKASARTSAVTITDSRVIKARSSKSQSVTHTSIGSFLGIFAPQLVQFDVKVIHFQTNEKIFTRANSYRAWIWVFKYLLDMIAIISYTDYTFDLISLDSYKNGVELMLIFYNVNTLIPDIEKI